MKLSENMLTFAGSLDIIVRSSRTSTMLRSYVLRLQQLVSFDHSSLKLISEVKLPLPTSPISEKSEADALGSMKNEVKSLEVLPFFAARFRVSA